ncbi:MAG: hypothetical protein EBX19_08340, partial [Actinobacteria bacterium]|nr:hypothetical protein [Actinomycetota bacterium]
MDDLLQFRQSSGAGARKIGDDFFGEAGQNAPGAELDQMGDAASGEILEAGLPADRAGDLV